MKKSIIISMKKFIKILLPFLVLSSASLVGCKNKDKKEPEKVLLTFGDVHAENVTEISTSRFSNLIKGKESFLFVVSSPTCSCWSTFRPNIEKYVRDNKLVCYQISYANFKDDAPLYGINGLSESTTTFFIYKDGAIKERLNSSSDSKTMDNYDSFVDYMNKRIEKPRAYYIKYEDFDTIKESGKNAVIYYERNGCGDCSSANGTILKNYVLNHLSMNKLYVLDFQDIYRTSDDPAYISYISQKQIYGMTEYNNPYGFGNGVFPFFSYIKNKEYESGCVLYNDTLEKVNESTFRIIDSYYTQERNARLHYSVPSVLQGSTLAKSEVIENASGYAYWDQEKANTFYGQVLNAFLDYSLPNVTYTF